MEGWGWQSVHDPEALPKVLDRWKGSIATGQPFDMVFPLRGADGAFRPFLTRVQPVKDENGNVVRWFGTNTDITEQMSNEENLARSNAELQQFAYVASHDLQEPLRMVISYTGLLNKKHGGELSEEAKHYMEYVNEGAERMRELVNDLLQYSRIDSQSEPFTLVDMNLVANKVVSSLKIAIEECKAEVVIESLPVVMADETQMSQLLQNLISNAIKFRGPEAPRVEVASWEGAREWTISVKDNGIGIAPKYQDKLFQMFQRLHNRDEYPGTGIGLAIAKKIVERHGGRIWLDSDGKTGSTFFFTMPKVSGGGN
jgi:light-regulated signal transduction histidine kinase (bacteriophytochrome)